MLLDLTAKFLGCSSQFVDLVAQLEDSKEIPLVGQGLLCGDATLEVSLEALKIVKSFLSEILGRRSVLLDALQMLDR